MRYNFGKKTTKNNTNFEVSDKTSLTSMQIILLHHNNIHAFLLTVYVLNKYFNRFDEYREVINYEN